ncbi:hypothetical protein MEW_04500 [Candida albicans P60002]|nr:hypothetical protein MGM_04601 [Candida albicans P75063]KHC47617.1 hypothetical protein MEW_04500 [Candida albicans P60002]KHC64040.1 hypothetical protein MGI_04556 [Candida albicans P75016]
MKHSYDDANSNINELERHLNYFINDMSQVYNLINEKALEVKSQQDRITMNNVDILDQILSIKKNLDHAYEEASEAHISNNQWAHEMRSSLEYSLFTVSNLNSRLQLSINDFIEQNEDIRNQRTIIFDEIFELFLNHLNESGQLAIDSFEGAFNLSLNILQGKIDETEEVLDKINSKVSTLVYFAESAKEYALSIFSVPNYVTTTVNNKVEQLKVFGNSLVMGVVLLLGVLCLLTLILLRAPIIKVFRFAFIGIPMIMGITLALLILKMYSTPMKIVDVN